MTINSIYFVCPVMIYDSCFKFFFEIPSSRYSGEFNTAVEALVKKFEVTSIESMKVNYQEVFKDEIMTINGKIKDTGRLSTSVTLLQKHVTTLRA